METKKKYIEYSATGWIIVHPDGHIELNYFNEKSLDFLRPFRPKCRFKRITIEGKVRRGKKKKEKDQEAS